jgi:hypothetical protein
MPTEIFLPLRLPIKRYTKWKPYCRKFVGVCKGPSQKAADLMQDLSTDTGLSIIEIKTKSQQIIKHHSQLCGIWYFDHR